MKKGQIKKVLKDLLSKLKINRKKSEGKESQEAVETLEVMETKKEEQVNPNSDVETLMNKLWEKARAQKREEDIKKAFEVFKSNDIKSIHEYLHNEFQFLDADTQRYIFHNTSDFEVDGESIYSNLQFKLEYLFLTAGVEDLTYKDLAKSAKAIMLSEAIK